MKILTLNTHGLQEEDYEEKLHGFLKWIVEEKPDLIALQEVSQSVGAKQVRAFDCPGMIPPKGNEVSLREDNHALRAARGLAEAGIECSWVWYPVKLGYGRFDEGLAFFSLCGEISGSETFLISRTKDYADWRRRGALGVCLKDRNEWFYTVHMGWWRDETESFLNQWNALSARIAPKAHGRVWVMGDFNAPAEIRGQGYDLVSASGWKDVYCMAREKDAGSTVRGAIDGWTGNRQGMRIDQIWCNRDVDIGSVRVVLDGKHGPVVSDHFGVLLEMN